MNEWIPVTDRNPKDKGRYLTTTINLKTRERTIGIGTYKGDGAWGSPYVIAWKDVLGGEPYQGETLLDEKALNLKAKKDAVAERRRKVFELRLQGMAFTDIAEENGASTATTRSDIDKYLGKGTFGKCIQCKHSLINASGKHNSCYCGLLRVDVWGRWSCEKYISLDTPRIVCTECKYSYDRYGFGRCSLKQRLGLCDQYDTCQKAEKKE